MLEKPGSSEVGLRPVAVSKYVFGLAVIVFSAAQPAQARLTVTTLSRVNILSAAAADVPSLSHGAYDFDGRCGNFRRHSYALVAALGLNEQYAEIATNGMTPREAEPYFRAMLAAAIDAQGLKVGSSVIPARPACASSSGPEVEALALNAAFALKRWGTSWGSDIAQTLHHLLVHGNWSDGDLDVLHNKQAWKPIAELLTAEVMCDEALWKASAERVRKIYESVMNRGPSELHSTHYGAYSLTYLAYLRESDSLIARKQAIDLLGLLLVGEAHSYNPGGTISFPLSRGARDSGISYGSWERDLVPMLAVLFEDETTGVDFRRAHRIVSGLFATGYEAPEVARSIARDKTNGGSGVTYRSRVRRIPSTPHAPQSSYGDQSVPTGAYILENGEASLGFALGHPLSGSSRLNGAVLSCPGCIENSVFVRHMAPMVYGDRDEKDEVGKFTASQCLNGSKVLGCESYDFEVYPFNNSLAILFNTHADRPSYSDPVGIPSITRQDPYSRAVFPDFTHPDIGGRNGAVDGWRTGRIGDVYVGWYPIGRIVVDQPMASRFRAGRAPEKAEYYQYVEFGEKVTGSVIEIASTRDFRSLRAFEVELASRRRPTVSGGARPSLTFEARDARGRLCALRLTMGAEFTAEPETRELDCDGRGFEHDPAWVALDRNGHIATDVDDRDFGPMSSPWVETLHNPSYGRHVRVERDGEVEEYYIDFWNLTQPFDPRLLCSP